MIKQLVFLLLLFFTVTLSAQSNKFFTTKGKEIIAPGGKPFLIKGTNLGNWLVPEGYMFKFKNTSSPRLINQLFNELIGPAETKKFWKQYLQNYITAEDIHYLKSIGMNSIRLPFHYKLFTEEDYLGQNNANHGFQLFDKLIGWCKKENLAVILDMHCAPGGQTGDNIDDSYGYPFLFDSEESQQLTIAIGKRIAGRYKNETIILGYDLLNEPIPHFFDTGHFNPKLEPLYKRITAAIRSTDKNHIIFLGGAQWDSNFKPFGPPFDNKLVYTFHKYWTDTTQQVIQDYIDFRNRYNVPIYVGETGENNDAWISAFRRLCEKNNIGWHFWPYKKMDNSAGIMSYAKPAGFDAVITYADSTEKNFEDIRKQRPQNMDAVKKIILAILDNCLFKNGIANQGYIKALGLKEGKQAQP
jgi:endoglucanase